MTKGCCVLKNRRSIIYAICLFIAMSVIFAFSSQENDDSQALSLAISDKVENVIESRTKKTFVTPEAKDEYVKKLKNDINVAIRKHAHAYLYAMFGLFAFLLFLSEGRCEYTASIGTIFLSTLYAMSDELHQCLTKSRGSTFQDVCIDVFGTAVMLMIIYLFRQKRNGAEK